MESPSASSKAVTVSVTPYELRLLEAARAEPNRVQFWTSYADKLGKTHKPLLALYNKFFHICNLHDIEYWLEYGSLLGYVRHRCITPWEWDMDVGCTPEMFRKLLEVGKWYEDNDPEWGFKFYHDPDYAAAGFSFYWKPNPEVLCDICEYVERGDELVCAVAEWNYPNYRRADVFPLRRVMMLGEAAFIPAKSERILGDVQDILGQCTGDPNKPGVRNQVPFMQYDPVPFMLCHLLNQKHNETLCSRPVIDTPEANTILEGMAKFASQGLPFVVRNCKELSFDKTEVQRHAAAVDARTFAFVPKTLEMVKNVSIADSIAAWEQGQLQLSFLDSPIKGLLSAEHVHPSLAKHGITPDSLMLVLSKRHNYTPFHIDMAYDGGGWMFLSKGKKVWNMIDFSKAHHLMANNRVRDLPMDQLLYEKEHFLWGHIYQAWMEAGDFLYFPPGMIHRVNTYEASIGLGGYATCDHDAVRVPEVNAFISSFGIHPAYGVWDGGDGKDLPVVAHVATPAAAPASA